MISTRAVAGNHSHWRVWALSGVLMLDAIAIVAQGPTPVQASLPLCNGVPMPEVTEAGESWACCDDYAWYDSNVSGCCAGSAYDLETEGCCFGEVYDLEEEACCENPDCELCGAVYDPDEECCCGGDVESKE